MSLRGEKDKMSSILPRGLGKKIRRILERLLPFRWLDVVDQFWVQTRLLFSRTLLLMVAALFAFFTWGTVEQETFREKDAYGFLMLQSIALAILLHMNLWETEREGRTFELLMMRIPGRHRMIWFKLRVSLFWILVLSLPFFVGYMWFVNIPVYRGLVYLFFCMSLALFVALVTCVVASFVHISLASGIITTIFIWIMAVFFMAFRPPKREYYEIFIEPFIEDTGKFKSATALIVNRSILFFLIAFLYSWFYERLRKTEKWIL